MTDAVYEPSYEAYEGSRTSRFHRLAAIARRGVAKMTRSTWFWVLIAATIVHLAIRGIVLYGAGQAGGGLPGASQLQFTGEFLTGALGVQARWIVTFMLAVVGTDVISEDLDTGGLTFYFTKPITKPGYLAGKLAAPFAAALAVTAVPLLILWGLGFVFTPENLHPDDVWMLPLALVAASLVISAMTTLVVAALSGLVGSRGRAAVVWIALVFVLGGAAQVAEAVSGDPAAHLIDPYHALEKVTQWLASVDASQIPEVGAGLTVAGWSLAALAGLWWTLHREEVAG